MKNYGFVKIACGIPFGKIADIDHNKNQIISMIKNAAYNDSSLILFPELSITSYTCQDLFQQTSILSKSVDAVFEIAEKTKNLNIVTIVGLPIVNANRLFNCAAVINKGNILGIIPKSYIPGYREFYEPRWFSGMECTHDEEIILNNIKIPFGTDLLFIDKNNSDFIVGVEICEDMWMPIPPSSYQSLAGATILCNLSASNILVGKSEYRREVVKNQASRCIGAYVYCSAGMGESTTDVVFDADATIVENGITLAESKRFLRENQIIYADIDIERLVIDRVRLRSLKILEKKYKMIQFECQNKKIKINRFFDPHPFVPQDETKLNERCEEIFNIQSAGLAKRLESIPGTKAVIGVSGGLDSTLALLVTIKAFKIVGRNLKDIIAVTMPGFGTSSATYNNIVNLCKKFDIDFREISIKDISTKMLDTINQSPDKHDVVYENIQARARTYLLMTIANKEHGIVIGTGDLSEIALGWSTYNGDHISMYNVNSSVPKTLVKFLIKWVSKTEFDNDIKNILNSILDLPISPELIPADGKGIKQKTEDIIGPYELHDFFLYYFIRFGFDSKKILFLAQSAFKDKYDKGIISKWLKVFIKRFFQNQWKRDCVPAGPKVGSVDLSPRGSWRMPSEAENNLFYEEG